MKCDMHVHTRHSGKCSIPLLRRICRESYNEPADVYWTLKRKGMDLVTITDHDSIDAAESLRRYPDFFLSEEVSVDLPSGNRMHVGVYDIDERQHIEIQRRRNDFESLIVYLGEQRLFYTANHVFSGLTGRRSIDDFELFRRHFPGIETLNGCMLDRANQAAAAIANCWKKSVMGGSDAHTMLSIGTAWTEVPQVRDRHQFFNYLRAGAARTAGTPGNYFRLTRDIFGIGAEMVRDNPWTAPIAILGVLIPIITLINYGMEAHFVRHWSHRALEMPVPVNAPQRAIDAVAEEVAA